jgi:hypothetical protein
VNRDIWENLLIYASLREVFAGPQEIRIIASCGGDMLCAQKCNQKVAGQSPTSAVQDSDFRWEPSATKL